MSEASKKPAATVGIPGPSYAAFDSLDLAIVLVVAYAAVFCFNWLGWRPRAAYVGPLIAPLVIGAWSLRARLWPKEHRVVERRVTWFGVIATAMSTTGFIVGGFGAYWLTTSKSAPEPVNSREIRVQAEHLARVRLPIEIKEDVTSGPDPVALDAGGFDELMAELGKGPTEAEVRRYEEKLREETLARNEEKFRFDRRRVFEVGTTMGLAGLLLLGCGTVLDRRRKLRQAK
jgi:hypothetical protein